MNVGIHSEDGILELFDLDTFRISQLEGLGENEEIEPSEWYCAQCFSVSLQTGYLHFLGRGDRLTREEAERMFSELVVVPGSMLLRVRFNTSRIPHQLHAL
jgi:hypothetical protein